LLINVTKSTKPWWRVGDENKATNSLYRPPVGLIGCVNYLVVSSVGVLLVVSFIAQELLHTQSVRRVLAALLGQVKVEVG